MLFIHFSSSLFNSALHLRVKLFLHLDYELDIHAACVPDIRFVRINQDYVYVSLREQDAGFVHLLDIKHLFN